MAMSDKINSQKTAGVAPATVVPKTQDAPKTAQVAKGSQKMEAFRNKGALYRKSLTDDQRAMEGSKSASIAFVACLGNPARARQRKVDKDKYVDSFMVVGYKFKALEDVSVPVADLKENCTDYLDVMPKSGEREVKAGEEFDLNVVETAMLMTRPEYAGLFSGEGREVYLSASQSKSRKNPTPCVKAVEGSIKENMILIADMVGQVDGKGGKPQVKEGYEKFSNLFVQRRTTRGGSSLAKKQSGETRKDIAAAFRLLFGN